MPIPENTLGLTAALKDYRIYQKDVKRTVSRTETAMWVVHLTCLLVCVTVTALVLWWNETPWGLLATIPFFLLWKVLQKSIHSENRSDELTLMVNRLNLPHLLHLAIKQNPPGSQVDFADCTLLHQKVESKGSTSTVHLTVMTLSESLQKVTFVLLDDKVTMCHHPISQAEKSTLHTTCPHLQA